ncbi:hypothetical protein HanPI659440_Chr01g0015351 [Helianthus annuus]|nr:hypothetical protein HanPI659440_Chr01g0015351 [Helianthus annuus]
MDASFYDLDISTPQTLHGSCRLTDHTPVNLTEFNSYGSWEEASRLVSFLLMLHPCLLLHKKTPVLYLSSLFG